MSVCKYCQKEITWIKEGRKNVPIEGDGSVHKCEERLKAMKSYKKIERGSLSEEEIKRYEKAMNEKSKK